MIRENGVECKWTRYTRAVEQRNEKDVEKNTNEKYKIMREHIHSILFPLPRHRYGNRR